MEINPFDAFGAPAPAPAGAATAAPPQSGDVNPFDQFGGEASQPAAQQQPDTSPPITAAPPQQAPTQQPQVQQQEPQQPQQMQQQLQSQAFPPQQASEAGPPQQQGGIPQQRAQMSPTQQPEAPAPAQEPNVNPFEQFEPLPQQQAQPMPPTANTTQHMFPPSAQQASGPFQQQMQQQPQQHPPQTQQQPTAGQQPSDPFRQMQQQQMQQQGVPPTGHPGQQPQQQGQMFAAPQQNPFQQQAYAPPGQQQPAAYTTALVPAAQQPPSQYAGMVAPQPAQQPAPATDPFSVFSQPSTALVPAAQQHASQFAQTPPIAASSSFDPFAPPPAPPPPPPAPAPAPVPPPQQPVQQPPPEHHLQQQPGESQAAFPAQNQPPNQYAEQHQQPAPQNNGYSQQGPPSPGYEQQPRRANGQAAAHAGPHEGVGTDIVPGGLRQPAAPSVNKYSMVLAQNAPAGSAPLPKGELILKSGYVLSRISFRTIMLKKWKQTYWVQYGPHTMLWFRSHSDFDDWLNNPYHTQAQRNFLVKLAVNFVHDLYKPNVRGYQVTQARTKAYAKKMLKQFKLERWMDYGPTIAAAFASHDPKEVDELRQTIIDCMRNTPVGEGIRATGAVAHPRPGEGQGPANGQPNRQIGGGYNNYRVASERGFGQRQQPPPPGPRSVMSAGELLDDQRNFDDMASVGAYSAGPGYYGGRHTAAQAPRFHQYGGGSPPRQQQQQPPQQQYPQPAAGGYPQQPQQQQGYPPHQQQQQYGYGQQQHF